MKFLNSMMAAITDWNSLFAEKDPTGATWGWVRDLMGTLSTVLWVVLALVGAAGGIYAVYVGIKMARAESAEQREENKKRLINIVVSIVVVIVLILFFNTFLPMILGALGVFDPAVTPADPQSAHVLTNTARVLLHI